MGVNPKIGTKESLNQLLLIAICFGSIWTFSLGAPTCKEGQKLRTDANGLSICCYTVHCNKSQDFGFCTTDQDYDFCIDCPPGKYSGDPIDTNDWKQSEKVEVCVVIPKCEAEEVILVGFHCQCNPATGHWGNDYKNCNYDKKNCKDAGRELDLYGNCNVCPENMFKPEAGVYGLCKEKTSCKEDEEEIDPGSTKTDRKCGKLRVPTTPATRLKTEPTNQTSTTRPSKTDEDDALSGGAIVGIVIVVLLAGMIVGCFVWKRRDIRRWLGNNRKRECTVKKPPTQDQPNEKEKEKLMNGHRGGILLDNNKRQHGDNKVMDENVINNLSKGEINGNGQNKSMNGDVQGSIKNNEQHINGEIERNVNKNINLDEHETGLKEWGPPPPEEPGAFPFIDSASLGNSINESNNSSSLGQNSESIVVHAPNGSVRQTRIQSQPDNISVHGGQYTAHKSLVSDPELMKAPTEPYGFLPNSGIIQPLEATQPEVSPSTPDGAHVNSPAQTLLNKENEANETSGNKTKPVATVLPMLQPTATADVQNEGQGSRTTAGGNDLQSPTPELQGTYKVIPNAPYGELNNQPFMMNFSRQPEETGANGESTFIQNTARESQVDDNPNAITGASVQRDATGESAEDNQESIDDYVGIAGIPGDEHDTESQAANQEPNMDTTASGNPLAAPVSDNSQDESSSNEPVSQHSVNSEDPEDEHNGEKQRLFQC